ncbi:hypothetical protein GX586_14190 [bacterium]|nr:hypothetical protein [bacterium]
MQSSRAVRRQWFLLCCAFLLINGYAVLKLVRWFDRQGGRKPVAVAFTPGEGAMVSNKAALTWRFSEPVAPRGEIGGWTSSGPVSFTPAVAGRFCWLAEDELVFEPAAPWRECTAFGAALDESFTRRAGLAGPPRFTFHTRPLELLDVTQVDGKDRHATLRLRFSSAPMAKQMKGFVTVTCDGEPVGYELAGRAESRDVLIETEWLSRDDITVTIAEGLRSAAGPLGTEHAVSRELKLRQGLALDSIAGQSDPFGPCAISAEFTAPLDFSTLRDCITISPSVAFTVEQIHGWRESGCRLTGAFQPGKTYTVTFTQGLKGRNNTALQAAVTRTVYMPDRAAATRFAGQGTYLSTAGSKLVAIECVNVPRIALAAERIYPNNLVHFAYQESRWSGWWPGGGHSRLSQLVASHEYPVPFEPNVATQVFVRLDDLTGGHVSGAFLLTVSADRTGDERQLVVATDIGLSVRQSDKDMLVWANSIRTAGPIADVTVRVYSAQNQAAAVGVTGTNGIVRFTGDFAATGSVPYVVVAERGSDLSYLRLDGAKLERDRGTDGIAYLSRGCEASVFTDRGIYRPGETAHVKAIVRDREMNCPEPFPVVLRVTKPDGRPYRTLNAMLSAQGTAALDSDLPVFLRTGRYTFELLMPGTETLLGSTTVSIEDFVPPQIKAGVTTDTARASASFPFTVLAEFLFGRPAAGQPVEASVRFVPVAFTHPRWSGYVFGDGERKFPEIERVAGSGMLDADGATQFVAEVVATWRPPSAIKAVLSATVREGSGRAVSAFTTRMVDVYDAYLGVQPGFDGDAVRAGEPVRLDVAAVLPDGSPAAVGQASAVLSKISWSTVLKKRSDGRYEYESERVLSAVATQDVALVAGTGVCSIVCSSAGQYLLSVGAAERVAGASIEMYAGSPDDAWVSWSRERPGRAELDLDRKTYLPGQTARLVIKAPFAGTALFTIESDRIIESRVLEMRENTREIEIPVTDAFAPNVYCSVCVLRPVMAEKMRSPHRASGTIALRVSRPDKRAVLALDAPAVLRPQSTLSVTIQVAAAAQQTEFSVAAVDEGICMLTDFETPDPLAYFEQQRRLGVDAFDVYSLLLPEWEKTLVALKSAPGGDGVYEEELRVRLNPVSARRFKPVALWAGSVMAASNGTAVVSLPVPEFTGRLRVMATSASVAQLGATSAYVTVKRPLVVRTSLPRFLAPDDRCGMPVQISNETGGDAAVRMSVTCDGPVSIMPAATNIAVARDGQALLALDVNALSSAGVARVTVHAAAGAETYDEVIELPVRPAAGLTAHGAFGAVEPGAAVALAAPYTWLPGTERAVLRCSGMPSLELAGGIADLLEYPYGCLEQTVSASLPLLFLGDLAGAVRPGSLGPEELARHVQSGILRVLSMQEPDGGFSTWPRSIGAYAWGSAYAAHFLVEAQRNGHEVPGDQLNAALRYLEQLVSQPVPQRDPKAEDAWRERMAVRSYACWVLATAGRRVEAWTARLSEIADQLDVPSRLNLAGALAACGTRRDAAAMLAPVTPVAARATRRDASGPLNSGARSIAVLLFVWLDIDPQAPIVAQLVPQAQALMNGGGWLATQERAWLAAALGRYARMQRGAEHTMSGLIAWSGGHAAVPETNAWESKVAGTVSITNRGAGKLYYYWRAQGVPLAAATNECDRLISVRRELLDVSGKARGAAALAQGELVVVKVALDTGTEERANIVVEDLLPAGLEIENTELRTSQIIPWVAERRNELVAVQNVEQRDDRMIVFIDSLKGRKAFYYAARAVTPGAYVYPAVSAECMYDLEARSVHGRTNLVVEAAY